MELIFRAAAVLSSCAVLMGGCNEGPRSANEPAPSNLKERNDLTSMRTITIRIGSKATYTAYVADAPETERLGLMNVTEAELPTDRGMIFVFPYDHLLSFWMRNTVIPLDIAYIRSDGTIVKTYTMEPLKEFGYSSIEPARFALELRAGQFQEKGIKEGDHVELPSELFN
jgi:hypothetical protein